MREITEQMIKEFNLKKLKFDMMGYTFRNKQELSFHHLLVMRKDCQKLGLGDGYFYENGAILVQETSHDYLHLIQRYDPEIFFMITSELLDENILRRIDINNLKEIRKLLLYFEKEHDRTRDRHKNLILKDKYIENRIDLREI